MDTPPLAQHEARYSPLYGQMMASETIALKLNGERLYLHVFAETVAALAANRDQYPKNQTLVRDASAIALEAVYHYGSEGAEALEKMMKSLEPLA
jgi:hypothetical protein